MSAIFPDEARQAFSASYPEQPHLLTHKLHEHDLLTLNALAELAESLPAPSVEYNRGDLPLGVDPDDDVTNGLTIGETIRSVDTNGSWAVLKNIEQRPEYEKLLLDLLAELKPRIEATTGELMTPEGFIFVSSPNAVTPFHFDPEHNILLQLKGSKVMTQFPAADERIISPREHERYFLGGHRNLVWNEDFGAHGTPFHLTPGQAIYVPVMAPHHVRVGPDPSISLSITWRSQWSYAEKDAHAFNAVLRRFGLRPRAPSRFPQNNWAKAYGWRVLRKAGIGEKLAR